MFDVETGVRTLYYLGAADAAERVLALKCK